MNEEAVPMRAINWGYLPKRYVRTNSAKTIKARALIYEVKSFQYQKVSTIWSPPLSMVVALNAFVFKSSLLSMKFSIFFPCSMNNSKTALSYLLISPYPLVGDNFWSLLLISCGLEISSSCVLIVYFEDVLVD